MATRPVYLRQLELGPMQNFIYLIGDPATHEAAVVDPGWEVPKIVAAAEADGYRITKAFLTHSHFDHVMGVGQLLAAVDVPVYAHQDELPFLDIDPANLKSTVDEEVVDLGQLSIRLLHTPGHTPGSHCLLVNGRLFTGDTLVIGACGRTDLPGGNPTQLFKSFQRLKTLDDATIVLPGHNYAPQPTSTIGEEKQNNPFLKIPTEQEFLRLVGAA